MDIADDDFWPPISRFSSALSLDPWDASSYVTSRILSLRWLRVSNSAAYLPAALPRDNASCVLLIMRSNVSKILGSHQPLATSSRMVVNASTEENAFLYGLSVVSAS